MLFTRMDLLNSQFLDKMNNNIGRLHYEDESRTPSLPTAMSNVTGPPPHCPSKRKYGEEQMEDRINCDDDHMTKMSRLFATQLARPSAGENRNEQWSLSHIPVEHITSSSNGLHGTHLYASISGYAVDQPLPLTKSSHDIGVGARERSVMSGAVERQQNRPSVITCAPASNRNCNLSHCHMNGCSPSPPADERKTDVKLQTLCGVGALMVVLQKAELRCPRKKEDRLGPDRCGPAWSGSLISEHSSQASLTDQN